MPIFDPPLNRPAPSLDPLADVVLTAHRLSLDVLVEAMRMSDAVRALWLRDQIEDVIHTLQAASNAAADRADLILRQT